jgi:DNA replication protein DnaC
MEVVKMALDGKILSRAIERYESERRKRSENTERLRREIYAVKPRVRVIDALLLETVAEAALAALGSGFDPAEAVSRAQKRNLELQAERAELITEAGYPMGCIDDLPECKICGDRGYDGRTPCVCLMKIYADEQRKELSSLLKLGEENFKAFNLDLYENNSSSAGGYSPRKLMEIVYMSCLKYAQEFNKNSGNLFLNGGTGLGKTFLSSCIAGEVSKKGYSVVYDTAASIISMFEAARFSRYGDSEDADSEINRYLGTDLLILDDLGTETVNSFTVSAIYNIINSRLISRKSTVISSNLSIDEIRKKYSPQIASRIEGEYENLKFFGTDIRLLKKQRGAG